MIRRKERESGGPYILGTGEYDCLFNILEVINDKQVRLHNLWETSGYQRQGLQCYHAFRCPRIAILP
jgi:hypothetical protein